MQGLLVTFCNSWPPDMILGLFDFENERFQWIPTTTVAGGIDGATGITFADDHYWIVLQTIQPGILNMDAKYHQIQHIPLPISRDAHSLVPHDGGFLIADTGRNCLNSVQLPDDTSSVVETEFWRQHPTDQEDKVHINSMCHLNGDLYVSFFGDKLKDQRASSRDGQVVNISTGEIVCNHLLQPHSLLPYAGSVYWLESKRGNLYKYTPGGRSEAILHLSGYLRGLVIDDDFIYIGASAERRYSRSTGALNVPLSKNPDDKCCWLYRVSQKTGKVCRYNFTPFGNEIYDLFPLSDIPVEMDDHSAKNATVQRLWRIEDSMFMYAQPFIKKLEQAQKELTYIQGTRWWRTRTYTKQLLQKMNII